MSLWFLRELMFEPHVADMILDFGYFWVGDAGSDSVTGFSPHDRLLDDECLLWVSQ